MTIEDATIERLQREVAEGQKVIERLKADIDNLRKILAGTRKAVDVLNAGLERRVRGGGP